MTHHYLEGGRRNVKIKKRLSPQKAEKKFIKNVGINITFVYGMYNKLLTKINQ